MEFDIEEWQRLAREDPESFERNRQQVIEEVITAAPLEYQTRLRGLQFRIDLERRRARTPLGAAIRLQTLMWQSFHELRGALKQFTNLQADLRTDIAPAPAAAERSSAQVLPFAKLR